MRLEELYFWQNWPMGRRGRYFMIMALLWALLWTVCYSVLSWSADAAESELGRLQARYERTEPLVAQLKALQSGSENSGNLSDLSPLAAAQQLTRDLRMQQQLASIRPAKLAGGQEGVQLNFLSLDRDQFVNLLQALNERGGMQIVNFAFNHRMDKPERADMQLVLVR